MTRVAVNRDRFVPFIRFGSPCEGGLRATARAINFECEGGGIQRMDERIRRDGIIVPSSASPSPLLFQNLNKYRLELGDDPLPALVKQRTNPCD